jgi:zinc protease
VNFGTPGTVAEQRTVDDLGVTYVRFANGVTLTVKPTQFHAGQILMDVRLGEGRIGLPRDHVTPAWALAGNFIQGGLAHYDIDDLQKLMSDRLWGASIGVGDDEFVLRGQARAADLDMEMQVLAAYVTDPSFKPEAFDQARIAYANNYAEAESSPSGILSREFNALLRSNDARWRTPAPSDITTATVEQEQALIAPSLKEGPIDITMVGDVTLEQAIQSVAATFGALPQRAESSPPRNGEERFPKGTPQPVVLIHHGAANQALAAIAWPTAGFYRDMKLQRTFRVLTEIFASRLLDDLRTKEGITYTPGASSYGSLVSPDYGFLYALAQIPPDKIANFYAEVATVADDLTATKVSDAELERARGPRIQDIQKQQQTNEYWLSLLGGSGQEPRLLDVIRSTIPDIKSVTAEDVQKAAKDWIKDDRAYLLVVVPDGTAPPALPH